MSYHPFTEDGHFCSCGRGPFICSMEDGHCDNDGMCNKCIKAEAFDISEDAEYRQEMQERYDDEFGTPY